MERKRRLDRSYYRPVAKRKAAQRAVKVEPIEVEEQTALEAMRSVGRMMSGRIERWEWQTSDRSAPALEKIVIREAQP